MSDPLSSSDPLAAAAAISPPPPASPRVTIQYCTQCKWMLRAAYFAQELLSTFSTSLGEVALQPSTGGVFRVTIETSSSSSSSGDSVPLEHHQHGPQQRHLLWDRKTEGGFPEVKELKRRVRDVIEPDRQLGHVDRGVTKAQKEGGDAGSVISSSSRRATTLMGDSSIGGGEGAENRPGEKEVIGTMESRDTGTKGEKECVDCQ